MRAPDKVGEFVVEERLGEGGMGTVYRVVHERTGARHALKLLTAPQDAEALQRFAREGQALAAVDDHPNIVRVHTAGEWSGRPYLVMQLCTGGDLKQRLRKGPLAPPEAARIVADVARGIAHVHARGIIHRDLKPENVLFDDAGQTRVSDFGLARVAGAGSLTATGTIVGTPVYMAPEQATDGRDIDERADVWGLGALLIAALTGRPPYDGGSPIAVLSKLTSEPPRWPSVDRPDTPPALEAIVRHAMARRPEDRYATAALLADDLERFLAGELDAPSRRSKALIALGATLAVAFVLAIVTLAQPPVAPPEVPPAPATVSPIASTAPTPTLAPPPVAPPPVAPPPVAGWRDGPPATSRQFSTPWVVRAMLFLDDRHLLLAGPHQLLLVDTSSTSGEITRAQVELRGVRSLALAGGLILAGIGAEEGVGLVRILRHDGGALTVEEDPIPQVFDDLLSIACSADGTVLVVVDGPGNVHALSLPEVQGRPRRFDGPRTKSDIRPCVTVSPDRRLVAYGDDRGVTILSLDDEGLTESSDLRTAGRPKNIAFCSARTLVVGTDIGAVQWRDLDSPGGEPVLFFDDGDVRGMDAKRAHLGPLRGLDMIGPTLLTLSGGQKQVENELAAWDLAGRKLLWRLPRPQQTLNLAVSPDGRRCAVGSNLEEAGGLVEVWTSP